MMTIRRCHGCQKFHRPDAMHLAFVSFETTTPKTTEKSKRDECMLCHDCFTYIRQERKA